MWNRRNALSSIWSRDYARKPKMHCIIRSKTDLLDSFDDTLQENLDRRGKNDKSAGIDQEGPRVI